MIDRLRYSIKLPPPPLRGADVLRTPLPPSFPLHCRFRSCLASAFFALPFSLGACRRPPLSALLLRHPASAPFCALFPALLLCSLIRLFVRCSWCLFLPSCRFASACLCLILFRCSCRVAAIAAFFASTFRFVAALAVAVVAVFSSLLGALVALTRFY